MSRLPFPCGTQRGSLSTGSPIAPDHLINTSLNDSLETSSHLSLVVWLRLTQDYGDVELMQSGYQFNSRGSAELS